MSACAKDGCKGTIEDGYCDTCGMAAPSVTAKSAAAPAAAKFTATSGTKLGVGAAPPAPASSACAQPGCAGVIEDGYCNTCGMAAAAPSTKTGSARTGSGKTP